MHLLSWFDNRTLLMCQFLLACIFAFVFLVLRRTNPGLRGVATMAMAFVIGSAGLSMVALRGGISNFISITVANGLIFLGYTLLCAGIAKFIGSKTPMWPLWVISALGTATIWYYSTLQHNIVPRIVTSALLITIMRIVPAVDLFQKSNGRKAFILLGVIFLIFAFLSAQRVTLTILRGAPADFMVRNGVQTSAMISGFLYVGLVGVFLLSMILGELRATTERNAQHDSLTAVLNRGTMEQKLIRELELAGRTGQVLSVVIIDIDHFKTVNDTAGHAAGDAALRNVADSIAGELRTYDTLGRYGGDEFLLLLPATAGSEAMVVTERIRAAVEMLSPIHNNLPLSVSVGIAQYVPSDSTTSVVARADQALYKAKAAGRNCIILQDFPEFSATGSSVRLTPLNSSAG